jgi:hypothetical protein
MQWTRLLLIVLIGTALPAASLCLSKQGLRYIYKVYHTQRDTKTFAKLGLDFAVTTISAMVLMLTTETLSLLMFKLAGLFIMSMIAYSDILAGRIPILFLFAAFLSGFAFGLDNDRWIAILLGGLTNLALGGILHWFGEKYAAMRFQKHPNILAFGMGDAYGAGAMGALVGLPLAVIGLLIALILAVLYVLPKSLLEKRALTSMTVKLGSSFLMASIVLFFFF